MAAAPSPNSRACPEPQPATNRSKGFNQAIAANSKLRIAAREVANFNRADAREIMTRLLSQGQHFDAVFAHNDSMILGVMDAVRQANPAQRPILVGFDAIPESPAGVAREGITATIAQRPKQMGALAVDVALKALHNEPVPDFIPGRTRSG